MRDIYFIIEQVKKRPKLFVGEPSLSKLTHFLSGANYALGINGQIPKPDYREFHVWVRNRLKLESLSVAYHESILEVCNGDEEKGLALFFELIEEFKKSEG